MKTVILQIEAYDTVASIRDKIKGCRSKRILLVHPRQKRAFPGRLELDLIARYARENGAAFALVSRNDITREHAESLGISVFGSIPEAQKGEWHEADNPLGQTTPFRGHDELIRMRNNLPKTAATREIRPLVRYLLVGISFLALAALMVFSLPSATLVVSPVPEVQTMTIDIRASTEIAQANLTGLLPAKEESLSVSGQKTIPATGSITVGVEKAHGEVLVRNLFTEAQEIPEGAIFETGGEPNIRFRALDEVNLPADGKGVLVKVEAVLPGAEGNVEPGMVRYLAGGNGLQVAVMNNEPITGGKSINVNSPTEADYQNARLQLLRELEEKALKEIKATVSQDITAIPNSLKFTRVETEERENPIGEPSDMLTINMTATFKMLVYDTVALFSLGEEVMDLSLPEGYNAAKDPLKMIQQGEAVLDQSGEASWQVTFSRQIYRNLQWQQLIPSFRGREKRDVVKVLDEEIPHVKGAEVLTFPEWWPWLPLISDRIYLVERASGNG